MLIVVNGMSIGKFSDIVGADASVLQPEWQVIIVETLGDEFRVAACKSLASNIYINSSRGLTPWRCYVCDVCITATISTNIISESSGKHTEHISQSTG